VNKLTFNEMMMGRHVAPLGHIVLIPSQSVFALSPYCCVCSWEATNTNFIVFGLTRSRLETTIYRTRGEHANHYATDAVAFPLIFFMICIPECKQQLRTMK